MNTLPTHIQRSYYAPDISQRRRDEHLPQEVIDQRRKSERMVLRGPGKVGNPGCDIAAIFNHCPDDLMKAIIHRYNQYNWLMAERKRLKAHGRQKIRLSLSAAFQKLKLALIR